MPSLPKFNLLVLSVMPERLGLPPFSLPQSLGKVINGLIFELGLRRRPPLLALLPMIGVRLLVGEETLIPLLKILGPWVYLEFRPYPVVCDDFFPPLSDTASLLADTSLQDLGLHVVGLVCTNLQAGDARHYWLIECAQGRPQTAYDSLKGSQKLTRELFRSLSVTGLLLTISTSKKPVLRTTDLDVAAGRVSKVERQIKPIKVAGRSASYRQRRALMPKLKNPGPSDKDLKSFLQDRPELLVEQSSGGVGQKKRIPSRSPGVIVDDMKRDPKVRSNPARATQTTVLAHQRGRWRSARKSSRNEVVAPGEQPPTDVTGPAERTDIQAGGGKESLPEDQGEHREQTAINVESVEDDELPRSRKDRIPDRKGEAAGPNNGVGIALEENAQVNLLPNDPISLFSSDDDEKKQPPSRLCKRPFEEVDLGPKAGIHGSPEDQKRRGCGPPQPPNLSNIQDQRSDSYSDAACYRASVIIDPVTEIAAKSEAIHTTGIDQSHKPEVETCQQPGIEEDSSPHQVTRNGGYGVISLFDGVSSVVPLLTQKFGYAPTVAILAENDTAVRTVVCAEFGYRADEQWGFTPQGMAALYLKDVHTVIANGCQILRSAIEAYPGLRWIIVGGSPCQDLTFAGPHKGLLGLAGPSSRLFFILLCVIFTVQQLCGPQAVRFLAENAASMLGIHYQAFCRLLNIEPDPPDKYLWNPSDFGYPITRRRNFFRNFDDVESIVSPAPVFDDHFGPLLKPNGDLVPLAPLLRTPDTLPNGIIRSSWTLYQPHALVWDYDYWNGQAAFAANLAVGTNNIPRCQWESIIPPPFLEQWKAFIQKLSSRNFQGSEIDSIVAPLIPMFHSEAYILPLRILKEQEVIQLSGLHDFWHNVSLSDAELVPEAFLRNVCGNCFHPNLVSSALGNNSLLRAWAKGEVAGPDKYVMNQTEAYSVFSTLCEQIEREAKTKGRSKKVQLDKTLPPYEVLSNVDRATVATNTSHVKTSEGEKSTGQPAVGLHQRAMNYSTGFPVDQRVHPQASHIHPPPVLLPKKVKVTKDMRFTQLCVAAAAQLLTPQQTSALKEVGMQRIFAALRAPVHVNFQFEDYITKLLGASPGKLQQMSSCRNAQCPDLAVVQELHQSFQQWEKQPGVCSLIAVCIAAAACKAGTSWPVGHVLLLPKGEEVYACYVGADTPKLLFLVDCKQIAYPLVTVVGATAYNSGIQLGPLPRWVSSSWKIRGSLADLDFVVEQRDGQWITNIGAWHTEMQGCPMCRLCQVGHLAACPWRRGERIHIESKSPTAVHMICDKDDNTSVIHLRGFLDTLRGNGDLWIFHVCTQQQILHLGTRFLPSHSPAALFVSTLSEGTLARGQGEALIAPFQHLSLPPELFRHFFIKTGGQASALDVWLQGAGLAP